MTRSDIDRVQAYLRRLLGTERIRIVAPKRAGLSVEVAAGDEVIGTLHRDTEDGEVSYSVHLTILEDDLPQAAPSAPSCFAYSLLTTSFPSAPPSAFSASVRGTTSNACAHRFTAC